ncbi:MAG: hypothetical protein AMXMBFR84_04040 [Candidatus Hydrogenedentota bacterium]
MWGPNSNRDLPVVSRRAFVLSAAAGAVLAVQPWAEEEPKETYETISKGIRILPGQWRPHYPWEQIAWVSPPWASHDYLWLDFPEAIFSSQGLLFLSHINPPFPTVFHDLPPVPWKSIDEGIAFERVLPNGIAFGGNLVKVNDTKVAMRLYIRNGSQEPLNGITLQTCAFLRAITEFADYTRDNKFIHVPEKGWVLVTETGNLPEREGLYRSGWRKSGKPVADWPVMATRSNKAERYVLMTWYTDTLSMVSNPNHPCMHADPQFKDLAPGEESSVDGALIFHEGLLSDIESWPI